MLTVFFTSNQIPVHVYAVFCRKNIIIYFPLHVHGIHLARGMLRMRIPSNTSILGPICYPLHSRK